MSTADCFGVVICTGFSIKGYRLSRLTTPSTSPIS